MKRIGIVAGEASGDLLGGQLIHALKKKYPDVEIVGIAGPKMIGEGAHSLYPIERLSVRGYVEVIKHLFALIRLRKDLLKFFLKAKIDLFIGIDAPDFNLWLEKKLKKKGIPTIHYVSPSVWAWRKNRMPKIKLAVTHMLALFPFEPPLYLAEKIPSTYVGHPLADMLPLKPDTEAARTNLKLGLNDFVIALLPGSRQSELKQHAQLFIQTAKLIHHQYPNVKFLVPLITRETRDIFLSALSTLEEHLPIQMLFGHSHEAMEASDLVILASGTATLEAALLKKPMIITYRMPNLSWQILKRMHLQPYVGLPNILAGKLLVPEFLQDEATPEKLSAQVFSMITDGQYIVNIKSEFLKIHVSLKQNSAHKAADVVIAYLS